MSTDFYGIFSRLPQEDLLFWERFQKLLAEHLSPIIDNHWNRGTFPHSFIKPLGHFVQEELGAEALVFPPKNPLKWRLMKLELGRVDPSMASFFAVHMGLTMGSISLFGSPEQKALWLPSMLGFEKIGSWALTEPFSGSDVASGLQTEAIQTDDGWLINGHKKWAGNASMADVIVVWAKEPKSKRMLGFLIEPNMNGVDIEKINDKIAKRAMENVNISLNNVLVKEDHRLPNVNHFRDINVQLKAGRIAVAWEALGIAMGAYEAALAYTKSRHQFGRPIASFQLIQDKLVTMLEEVTCMQALLVGLAETERTVDLSSAQASLAKRACARRSRKVCQLAREVLGGNGILLEHGIARLFADIEAVYSYEGTDEINTLIVGRAITGSSSFL
ncbi:MAG: acyl-CoA dehydrogenase [Proteobacteria bacterium]|nr:acyl-CoA dehydrogenase [Pseudomonadota bacterium]